MKDLYSLLVFTALFYFQSFAQSPSPVSWDFKIKKDSDTEYTITATATMQKSWVLYSQFTSVDGPIPTEFILDGSVVSFDEKSKVIKEFDDLFGVDVMKFKEKAIFTTVVKRNGRKTIGGSVEFMTCDGERCLPPTVVKFDLKF